MRVTVLGSGTAVPSAERFPAGVLVEGGGETVLVDAGPGVLRRLAAAGVGLERVTAVLLTHYHTDHCADLAALLFGLRHPSFAGRPPLLLAGGPGLHALLRALRTAWPRWLEPRGYVLEEREIAPGSLALRGLAVTAVAVEHTPESLAYRLEEPRSGATVAISGDADTLVGLAEAARGADLFVCEAARPEGDPGPRHLTASQAGAAAAAAGVRRLCLTHVYPECEPHDLAAEARTAFGGEVVVAHDLLVFDLG